MEARDTVTIDALSYYADHWLASVERLRHEANIIMGNSDLFNQTCALVIEHRLNELSALVLANE
mgnify:CR=1 FL=1